MEKTQVFFRRPIGGNKKIIGYRAKDPYGKPKEKAMITDSAENGVYLPSNRNESVLRTLYPKRFEAIVHGGLFDMTTVSDGIFFDGRYDLSVTEIENGFLALETDKKRYPYPYMQEDAVLLSSSLSFSDPTARCITRIPLKKGSMSVFPVAKGIFSMKIDAPSKEKRIYGFPVALEIEEIGRLYALPYFSYDSESEKTDMIEALIHGTPHHTSRRYVLMFDAKGREITFPGGARPRQIIALSKSDVLVRCEDERFFRMKAELSPIPVAVTGLDGKTKKKLSEYRVDKAYDCGEGKFLLRYTPFEETPKDGAITQSATSSPEKWNEFPRRRERKCSSLP